MEVNEKEGSESSSRMPNSGNLRKEGQGALILTKKVFTLPKASRSSRSMWARPSGKWMQLFSDGVPLSRLAPTPARKTRQQSSAELGIAELCFLQVGLVVWFCKSKPLMCRPSPTVPPFYIVGSVRPLIHSQISW